MTATVSRKFLGLLLCGAACLMIGSSHNIHANDTEYVVSACFNQSNKVLVMNCSAGHMVRVNQVFYGHSSTGRCGHSPGDCRKDVPGGENYPCVGHHTCGINLPSGDTGRVIPSCNLPTTYMQAHYMCVDVSDVVDICRADNITGQKGYIKTPQYPINYPTHTECEIRVLAPYPSQRIRLYAIDFQLETNNTRCPDLFKVEDALKSHSACGARARDHLFTSASNWINIGFISNNVNRHKGFWLYYEAWPFMNVTSSTSTTTTTTTLAPTPVPKHPAASSSTTTTASSIKSSNPVVAPNVTDSPGELTTQTVNPTVHVIYQLDNPFPLGILVGVFLGALLVVLVILLIILLLKRRSESGMTASSSVTSQTAFLGTKNNLQQAGQVHCINNHLYTAEPAKPGGSNKEKEAVNSLSKGGTEYAENVDPPSGKKGEDLELGIKDQKYLPVKAPYIETNDIGEEMLYC